MKLLMAVLILFTHLLIFNGCTKEQPAGETQPDTLAVKDTLSYEMKEFEKTSGDCDTLYSNCAYIKLRYPEFASANESTYGKIQSSIDDFILQPLSENHKTRNIGELMGGFIKEYQKVKQDYPEQPGWSVERQVRVTYNNSTLICLSMSEESYTGGAHPMSLRYYKNFQVKTGGQIRLSDLFIPGYEEQLNQIAEKEFRHQYNIRQSEELVDAGFNFENNQFKLSDDFAIGAKGLTFYFNPYEIAPYALGPTEIFLDYKSLREILKDNALNMIQG